MATLESDVSAITEIEKGINAIAHSGTLMFRPYFLGLLADAHRYNGRYDDAMSTALRALKQSDGAPWWRPELYRLIGQLQIDQPREGADSAELSLNRSLRAARDLEAKTLELRTSVSLARLWQSQGKTTEAHDLLSPVYSWFTEGFGTPHLQDAKALLDELT